MDEYKNATPSLLAIQSISLHAVWQPTSVTRQDREIQNRHKSFVLWFTGLSGSGKSSMIHLVERSLYMSGCHAYSLDGDNVRHGLCNDLDFSVAGRKENIRRIGETAKLMMDAGLVVLCGFISPFSTDRQWVRNLIGPGNFIEIYCRCPLEVCESRDIKGFYRKARIGEIQEFTGISSPYEPPESPELILDTGTDSIEVCVQKTMRLIAGRI